MYINSSLQTDTKRRNKLLTLLYVDVTLLL